MVDPQKYLSYLNFMSKSRLETLSIITISDSMGRVVVEYRKLVYIYKLFYLLLLSRLC
jgi:hypothetical protein